MTFRYIGSKARLVEQITEFIGEPKADSYFIDAFCGTGVVAESAAKLGWNIRVNDNLLSAVLSSGARLTSEDQANFLLLGGYEAVIDKLNNVTPKKGFMWKEYSPASFDTCGVERRYFTELNAQKIDAIRSLISEWSESNMISEIEERLLIADLFSALNRVANIAGTFGCFLSKWTRQSENDINMCCRVLKKNNIIVETSVSDVFDIVNREQDLVYLDPPYTKRQYASYYHILETIAWGDEPIVSGVCGLRPWKELASDFCYKTRALNTLIGLVKHLNAKNILISYSSEGHIAMDDMKRELELIGQVSFHPMGDIGRYRPNKAASRNGAEVSEFIVVINK